MTNGQPAPVSPAAADNAPHPAANAPAPPIEPAKSTPRAPTPSK
jgi:hypothetical protein